MRRQVAVWPWAARAQQYAHSAAAPTSAARGGAIVIEADVEHVAGPSTNLTVLLYGAAHGTALGHLRRGGARGVAKRVRRRRPTRLAALG